MSDIGHIAFGPEAPAYEQVTLNRDTRWRLAPRSVEGGYEAWPALDELFPVTFQPVNPSRGLSGSWIDTDRKMLEARIADYLGADDYESMRSRYPALTIDRSRHDAEAIWDDLRQNLPYNKAKVVPLLTFPLDRRWAYYEPERKVFDERSPRLWANRDDNEFLITVPEPRKETETRPVFSTILANLHVHERGSVVFPRETTSDDLFSGREANVAESVWQTIAAAYGLDGTRRGEAARNAVGKMFRVVFAMLFAPSFQTEHKSALSADWAHVPIPRDKDLFERIVEAGSQVTRLLDTSLDAAGLVEQVLGIGEARALGVLKRADGGQVRPTDLKVTVTYWGGGKGRWTPRARTLGETPPEAVGEAWGERTGDLFINDDAFFSNVPEAVWNYQLGGYPVLKKWLGYRQANRIDGRPLTDADRRWFRSMVQRISTLLAVSGRLDDLYQECIADAFTATDLGIAR